MVNKEGISPSPTCFTNENLAMMSPREYDRLRLADEIVQMELFLKWAYENEWEEDGTHEDYFYAWRCQAIGDCGELYKQYKAL